ncbi:MAG: helix-turn-helix domain-containing protein [Sulfurimonas sp.]
MKKNVLSAGGIIDKLISHFAVKNDGELAEKININRQTIAGWRHRNSINIVRKVVNKLELMKEIFPDDDKVCDEEIDNVTSAIFVEVYRVAIENDELYNLRSILIKFSNDTGRVGNISLPEN